MRGKPTRRRRRIQMLHYLANDDDMLNSNGQQRTEMDGDTDKGRLLTLMSQVS